MFQLEQKFKSHQGVRARCTAPLNYIPLSFPNEKCASWTEVALLCPLFLPAATLEAFLEQ